MCTTACEATGWLTVVVKRACPLLASEGGGPGQSSLQGPFTLPSDTGGQTPGCQRQQGLAGAVRLDATCRQEATRPGALACTGRGVSWAAGVARSRPLAGVDTWSPTFWGACMEWGKSWQRQGARALVHGRLKTANSPTPGGEKHLGVGHTLLCSTTSAVRTKATASVRPRLVPGKVTACPSGPPMCGGGAWKPAAGRSTPAGRGIGQLGRHSS